MMAGTRFHMKQAVELSRRTPTWAWAVITLLLLCAEGWHEYETSAIQSRLLSQLAARVSYTVEPGPSPTIVLPQQGPLDERRGYARIDEFARRLAKQGFRLTEQARFSPMLAQLAKWKVPPPYREKAAAGLVIRGRGGDTLFDAVPHDGLYQRYDNIPPLVVNTLLYIENRKLGGDDSPSANPAVDWGRSAKAGLLYAGSRIGLPTRIEGGSTLAVQLEKYRHSGAGQTHSGVDKLRQIFAASLRAYRDGPDTRVERRRIVLDYLNTMPLAASAGHGEVEGLRDGLRVWFGLDPDQVGRDLRQTDDTPAKARAYKHTLALLYAVRAPSDLLVHDRASLEARIDNYTRLLEAAGLVSHDLAQAVRETPLRFADAAQVASTDPDKPTSREYKAENALRRELANLLDVPSYYDLNRLDLRAETSIDVALQDSVEQTFARLASPEFVAAHGLMGEHLLPSGDPSKVIYSMLLYDVTPDGDVERVHTDNLHGPFDVNEDMKMELGSTAKLRTLAHYLEIVSQLHQELSPLKPDSLRVVARDGRDELTRWAAGTLLDRPGAPLDSLLEWSLDRTYSASPYEQFFTGGGVHSFENFDADDNHRIVTVREAVARSVNLAFIRLMRDVVRWHEARLPYDADAVLDNPDHPLRHKMLLEAADEESRQILAKSWKSYRGLAPAQVVNALLGSRATAIRSRAVLYFAWHPGASAADLQRDLGPGFHGVPPDVWPKLAAKYARPEFTLLDYAYLLGRHPLDVWCAGAMARDSSLKWSALVQQSAPARALASQWLLEPKHVGAQNLRLRIMIERDAFEAMTPAWRRLGFPFAHLVPSYATAIGSSGDRPAALAELMGIIVHGGTRQQAPRLRQVAFAPGTPYETAFEASPVTEERLMSPQIAAAMRRVLLGPVDHGTAVRLKDVFLAPDSTALAVGGKTGSGDNRFETFAKGGRLISSKAVSRTAAFVFYLGPKHYGVITAGVFGPEAEHYVFTSALPLAVMRIMAPAIQQRLLGEPRRTPELQPSMAALTPAAKDSAGAPVTHTATPGDSQAQTRARTVTPDSVRPARPAETPAPARVHVAADTAAPARERAPEITRERVATTEETRGRTPEVSRAHVASETTEASRTRTGGEREPARSVQAAPENRGHEASVPAASRPRMRVWTNPEPTRVGTHAVPKTHVTRPAPAVRDSARRRVRPLHHAPEGPVEA
ncbi:MAG TPA: transglycosylase domain-containing protein [Candidatus Eisenbacteria bacterium]|nr:transglycosylase domain-containing protein [Candidatus Eisenbacteria bacterium]